MITSDSERELALAVLSLDRFRGLFELMGLGGVNATLLSETAGRVVDSEGVLEPADGPLSAYGMATQRAVTRLRSEVAQGLGEAAAHKLRAWLETVFVLHMGQDPIWCEYHSALIGILGRVEDLKEPTAPRSLYELVPTWRRIWPSEYWRMVVIASAPAVLTSWDRRTYEKNHFVEEMSDPESTFDITMPVIGTIKMNAFQVFWERSIRQLPEADFRWLMEHRIVRERRNAAGGPALPRRALELPLDTDFEAGC